VRGGLGRGRGVGAQLVEKLPQLRITGGADLVAQPGQQVRTPRSQRQDARGEPVGVQAEPQHVARRLEQSARAPGGQDRDRAIGVDELPVPVHDQRRVGLVGGEDARHRVRDGGHRRVVEAAMRVRGGEPGGQQQGVAVAQRDVEVLAEAQQHRPRRAGATGLDEAQVPGRDAGRTGEGELAQPAAVAPLPQELTGLGHAADGSGRASARR